jgi:hypothetical protein
MNTNTNLVGIEGGRGYFSKSRGGGVQKKFGEENRHFESWRGGKKSTPWPEYIPLKF